MTTDANWIREQITTLGTSQSGLAKALEIDERAVRRIAAGQERLPKVVKLAIEWLIEQKRQQIL